MIVLSKLGIGNRSGTDEYGCDWVQYDIDPFARDCECEGPECDPDSCPRFIDECNDCGAPFSGSGWLCLDGGDAACDDCIEFSTG